MANDGFISDDDFQPDDEFQPEADVKSTSLGEGLRSDVREVGAIAQKGPIRYLREKFMERPSLGRAYELTNEPSKRLGERLRAAIAKIPNPERRYWLDNVLLGTPKAALEVGADFAEAGLKPENVAMSAVPFARIGKGLSKSAGALGRVQSGVDLKAGERLFSDPGALFTKSREAAGKALGQIRKGLGFIEERKASDFLQDIEGKKGLSFASGVVKKLEAIEAGKGEGAVKIPQILKALQNIQRKLRKTPHADSETRYELANAGRYLTDQLEKLPGSELERKAAKQFARSALASEFRRFLPVTKAGDISVGRTAFLPVMAGGGAFAGGLPAAAALAVGQSPALAGLEISALGGFYKAASAALQNPKFRTAILTLLNQERSNANSASR